MTRQQAKDIRASLKKAVPSLADEDAILVSTFFPIWQPDTDYTASARVRDPEDSFLYKLIPETHHSQADWPPHLVPAIWTRVDDPDEEWPEWRQPTSAQDAYAAGKKVSHSGKHWLNTYGDGNVWEPGVYGWDEVE